MKTLKKRSGSALLIAMLMTALLTLLTVSLAHLITSETRQLSFMIRNGHSQYLAEAGSEVALYTVHQSAPGFELAEGSKTIELSDNEQFTYQIDATTSQLPIVEDYIRELVPSRLEASYLFDNLFLNESIVIPFQEGVNQFEFQYYLPVQPNVRPADWDILLWKMFGYNDITSGTDSMSEYLPAAEAFGDFDSVGNTNSLVGRFATTPAKFGTVPNAYNCGLFFEYSADNKEFVEPEEGEKRDCKQFDDFLVEHTGNSLIVKNAINPAQIDLTQLDAELAEASTIKYRVCTPSCGTPNPADTGLVPEFTTVSSGGLYADTEKELLTRVNREGFLPVFDFSIYRTDLN